MKKTGALLILAGMLAGSCNENKEKADNIRKYGIIAAELIERGHDPIRATEIATPVQLNESGIMSADRLKHLTDSLDQVLKQK